MKIKKFHILFVIVLILIIILAFNYKSHKSQESSNKINIEESLNKEIEITPEVLKETTEIPQKEETKEERVKKMYEMMPPSEIIVE
ncbi:MAG: hypothetical protein NZ841_05320 [Dictyoglomus sp.]|nr:hypothetical protein [Dictyoglomus sp.]MDW8188699.1 hypothetical protein [Dictyoglomus sp.]